MSSGNILQTRQFYQININDSFFSTLKDDYPEFEDWFERKRNETALIFEDASNAIQGFLYTKIETEEVVDVTPTLPPERRLKIGTFKVNAHGTRLGEKFMKSIFDTALDRNVNEIYVTIFPKHNGLYDLLTRYGFAFKGIKKTNGHEEHVLVRELHVINANQNATYPFISDTANTNHYLLSIYPKFHTRLFPDSKLKNEKDSVIGDYSEANSIHKIYLTSAYQVETVQPGDVLCMYRTGDGSGPAEYSSVVTSICVIEEFRWINSFKTLEEFLRYSSSYSVFTNEELIDFYRTKKYNRVIKFSYNAALRRRLTRKVLADQVGLSRDDRWTFIKLSTHQFNEIVRLGDINARLIIHSP